MTWKNYILLTVVAILILSVAGWTDWSEWSTTCTAHESGACGSGTQTRSRTCPASDAACDSAEERTQLESRACAPCGVWTDWVPATQCSATCGAGTLTQTRTCHWAFPNTASIIGCQPHCSEAEVAASVGTTRECGTMQKRIAECNLRACSADGRDL